MSPSHYRSPTRHSVLVLVAEPVGLRGKLRGVQRAREPVEDDLAGAPVAILPGVDVFEALVEPLRRQRLTEVLGVLAGSVSIQHQPELGHVARDVLGLRARDDTADGDGGGAPAGLEVRLHHLGELENHLVVEPRAGVLAVDGVVPRVDHAVHRDGTTALPLALLGAELEHGELLGSPPGGVIGDHVVDRHLIRQRRLAVVGLGADDCGGGEQGELTVVEEFALLHCFLSSCFCLF